MMLCSPSRQSGGNLALTVSLVMSSRSPNLTDKHTNASSNQAILWKLQAEKLFKGCLLISFATNTYSFLVLT
jgi:hypothetical protein